MEKSFQQVQEIWNAFLKEWPIQRLRQMAVQDYTAVGEDHTFTAWIERRLDAVGSIWGGSSFKFGIFSRKDKTLKENSSSDSYTQDYGWYTKYGSTPEEAFTRVKSLVVQVAEAAARGDYAAVDGVDLGEAYKWKIAFHYQDLNNPGVLAIFKPKRLREWLKGRVGTVPDRTSELYRSVLSLHDGTDLMRISVEVWEQTAESPSPAPSDVEDKRTSGDDLQSLPLNLILYGPPGTGKTFRTTELAVRICDGECPESREALLIRYRELRSLRRIRFVTFHPSFSYEDFVEGIRPSTENGQVRYDVRPGVFKQVVTHAREHFEKREAPKPAIDLKGRKLFKMSLGDTTDARESWIYPDCIENDYVCLGFSRGIDFSGCDSLLMIRDRYRVETEGGKDTDYAITAIHYLKNELKAGDLVLISDGNTRFRAIAEVTGRYQFQPREEGYEHRRPVRWLWTSADSVPSEAISSKRLSQMSIYRMDPEAIKWDALEELLLPKHAGGQAPNCVLVIDEINRANLAKTFGELITLLEPSKRLGQPDEQETELPYSGDWLGVPPNLYLIGTMNTADRSIALMDTALRRRFAFREMAPEIALLSQDVEGIDLRSLLDAMNQRIESLFDRDHVLGHSYFMGVASFEALVQRFQNQIIPLLQEYFFEDWRRIQQVFNDVDQPSEQQIIQSPSRFEDGEGVREGRWKFRVNPDIPPSAIRKIYM